MATVLNTLYPPTIQSSMPTFPYNQDVNLFFSVSSYTNVKDIEYIHVSIVSQKTNRSVFQAKTSNGRACYPTVMLAKMPSSPVNQNSRTYMITIPKQVIKSAVSDGWDCDTFYKVQIRFDMGGVDENNHTIFDKTNNKFYDWVFTNTDEGRLNVDLLKNQYYLKNSQNKFSEWSTVCLLRPIPTCGLFYESGDSTKVSEWKKGIKGFYDDSNSEATVVEDYPAFSPGEILISTKLMFYIGDDVAATSEKLASYSISVYDDAGIDKVLETETLYPIDTTEDTRREIYTYLDISPLETSDLYKIYNIRINYTTTNGYSSSLTQKFTVMQGLEPSAFTITPTIDNSNGIIRLRILQDDVDPSTGHPKTYSDGTSSELFPGFLHIKRTSSRSKFKEWETMRVYSMGMEDDEDAFIDFVFEDNTIESRTGYIYSAQYENIANNLYPIRRTDDIDSYGDILMVDFDGPVFSAGDNQIRLEMNYNISSMALNVNRSKVETLGSVYPKFAENGVYNYKSFSISGRISAQLDDGSLYTLTQKDLFELETRYSELSDTEQGYYGDFKGYLRQARPEYLTFITKKKTLGTKFLNYYYSKDSEGCYDKWGNWLEYNDWMWEREFREQLIKWLNNGRPKLYRSLTEGNLAVILSDVQLQPVDELGRRIWDFSANMYEVGDGNSMANLDKLKIYDVIDSSEASYNKNVSSGGQDIEHLYQLYDFTLGNLLDPKDGNEKSFEIVNYVAGKMRYKYTSNEKNVFGAFFINEGSPFYLRSIKLQFLNPPHLFKKEEPSLFEGLKIPRPIDPAAEDFDEKDLIDSFYGYYVIVKMLNDSSYSSSPVYKGFYVNSKGYMQFPDNIQIQEIYFPQMNTVGEFADDGKNGLAETVNVDRVNMQFLACYKLSSTGNVVSSVNYSSFIVSQVIDNYQPTTSISDSIYRKYYTETRNEAGDIINKRYIDHWKGISLTTRPHALFTFTYAAEAGKEDVVYETGMTGTLNLGYYFPCKDMSFSGLKFYHNDDPTFLNEYEYHRDKDNTYKSLNDIEEPQNQWAYYIEQQGWYIYWNREFYRFIEGKGNDTLNVNDFIIDDQDDNKTYLYWIKDQEQEKYYNVPIIGNGKENDIYYLWYNNEWYDLSAIYEEIKTGNEDVGIGMVPVDATLMYSGVLVRYNY